MLKSSKWIKGIEPNHPVSSVARRALDERLKRVWYYAKLAAKKPEENIEHVHQLRVSTRRARAAVRIFGDMLPRRRARWLKKTLRALRHAAGDARDLDVLGDRLASIAQQKKNSKLGKTVAQIGTRRCKAQKPLVNSYKHAKRQGFTKRSRALKKRIRWRSNKPEPIFADAARERLAPPVEEFFTAAAADLTIPTALHEMRIAGKRLRYAMELLAGAFDDAFRTELYPIFAEVQDELGIVNDHATAITMFGQWLERAKKNGNQTKLAAELEELIASEEQQLVATGQKFRAWWTAERAAELKARFDTVLSVSPPESASNNGQPLSAPRTIGRGEEPVPSQEPTNGETEAAARKATMSLETG